MDRRTGHEIMKENQNRMHNDNQKGCQGDAETLPLKVKAGGGLWKAFEHKGSFCMNDLAIEDRSEVQNFVVTCSIPSSDKELSVKDRDFYTDKSVNTYKPPETIICYSERTQHVMKDISIDEGVPPKDKIMVENRKDKHMGICDFSTPDVGKNKESSNENIGDMFRIPDGATFLGENNCGRNGSFKEAILTSEANIDVVKEITDVNVIDNENIKSKTVVTLGEFVHLSCAHSSASEEAKDSCSVEKLFHDGNLDSGSISFHVDSPKPLIASDIRKSHEHSNHVHTSETQTMSRLEDVRLSDDGLSIPSQLHPGPGDASFSAAGHLPSIITYSGPMAYSGSVSLRSDSSTTSARSFAFPVLQSEWNSSPVRMAKADQRHFRKRGCKMGFLCCGF